MAATIKLEFNPGDSIEEAFSEAIRIATILNVWVEFNFNGVTCITNSKGNIDKGIESYHAELKKEDYKSKVAFA